jgi:hypothetical protein
MAVPTFVGIADAKRKTVVAVGVTDFKTLSLNRGALGNQQLVTFPGFGRDDKGSLVGCSGIDSQ